MNAMAGAFAGESLTRDPDAEDPHMLQYVEAELAKRRQASGGEPSGVAETAEDAPKPPPSAELWETPAALAVIEAEEETPLRRRHAAFLAEQCGAMSIPMPGGHLCHFTHAEAFNAKLMAWLDHLGHGANGGQ